MSKFLFVKISKPIIIWILDSRNFLWSNLISQIETVRQCQIAECKMRIDVCEVVQNSFLYKSKHHCWRSTHLSANRSINRLSIQFKIQSEANERANEQTSRWAHKQPRKRGNDRTSERANERMSAQANKWMSEPEISIRKNGETRRRANERSS